MKTPPIILASRSPRRNVLLRQIGIRFTTHPSRIPEDFDPGESPVRNAKRIALAKALEVAKHYSHAIVVSADTIVVRGKRMLGTPSSVAEAQRMLKALSGKVHTVITAFVVLDCRTGRYVVFAERTRVTFRRIEPKEIRSYVASGSPMDKAGAYGIQDDYGAVFVKKIDGCFYNVVGFPLMKFHLVFGKFRERLHYH